MQGAACLVEQLTGAYERRRPATTVDAILDREMRITDRLHQLGADDSQRTDGALDRPLLALFCHAGIARHRRRETSLRSLFARRPHRSR